jgi:hypothetical protein
LILNLQGYDIKIPNPPQDKDIFGYDKPKAEQYWVRPYQYTDEQYDALTPAQQEEISRTEIERRVAGFWFFNNGVPTWMTGDAYFYFTHWRIGGAYPLFIMNQLEDFYFDYYCDNDPMCLGSIRMKPRQEGCTQRRLSSYINSATLNFHQYYGIQSKTGGDAEEKNYDQMVASFAEIPEWMKPQVQSPNFPPHKVLHFGKARNSNGKSKAAKYLNSRIDWEATVKNAYDGATLNKIILDEGSKWEGANVLETWNILKPALEKRKGKCYMLSTVGETNEESVEAWRKLWRDSNINERDENGFTKSKLYRWFIPNYCAKFDLVIKGVPVLDKYGYLNIPVIQKYLKNEFDAIVSQHDKMMWVRKYPANADEALNYGASSNVFDTFRLSERLKELDDFQPTPERPVKYLKGNLYWVNNERFGNVEFKAHPDGKWKIAYLPNIAGNERTNMVFRENNIIKPFSHTPFRMGVDPYSYNDKEGDGFSKGAFHVKIMSNANNPNLSFLYCVEYIYREKLAEMFYEDVALTMFFYGAKVNIERSAYSKGLEDFMVKNHLKNFMMLRPDVTKKTVYTLKDNEAGTPSTEATIAQGIRYIENYIAEPNPLLNENTTDYLKLFWFEESIKQLMDYTVKNKTRYDAVASMIHTEIACQPDKRVKEAAKDHVEMRAKVMRYMFRQPEPQNQTRALA